MPWRRFIAMIVGNPRLIESLSETRLMRRAAQITVGVYNRFKANGFQLENSIKHAVETSENQKNNNFLSRFKEEIAKEHKKMKKEGKL